MVHPRVTSYGAASRHGATGAVAVGQPAGAAAPTIPGNERRHFIRVQNAGTSPITWGTSAASAPNGEVLRAGAGANDGSGGTVELRGYAGPIFLYDILNAGGITARYVETEYGSLTD